VSHETTYRSLYVQARGVLKKELLQYLWTYRPIRRSRQCQRSTQRSHFSWLHQTETCRASGGKLCQPDPILINSDGIDAELC
jgi:hypothetical protein